MSQNQRYKQKYDELRDGNPATSQDENIEIKSEGENQNYDRPGNIRNLCFAWPDGKKQFLNYAYLVSGELNIADDTNVITLAFTTYTVTLKGYNLDTLFSALVNQTPSVITQTDLRYASDQPETRPEVIEISIEVKV